MQGTEQKKQRGADEALTSTDDNITPESTTVGEAPGEKAGPNAAGEENSEMVAGAVSKEIEGGDIDGGSCTDGETSKEDAEVGNVSCNVSLVKAHVRKWKHEQMVAASFINFPIRRRRFIPGTTWYIICGVVKFKPIDTVFVNNSKQSFFFCSIGDNRPWQNISLPELSVVRYYWSS